jgi:hypothetical protein
MRTRRQAGAHFQSQAGCRRGRRALFDAGGGCEYRGVDPPFRELPAAQP